MSALPGARARSPVAGGGAASLTLPPPAVCDRRTHLPSRNAPSLEVPLLEQLLAEQGRFDTAVARFSQWHDEHEAGEPLLAAHYRQLIPLKKPGRGEQYAFEVKLDECTGCKACVTACHSLNGLDDDESWRDMGMLVTRQTPVYQQTVTTACHHCADPACASGCPVLAYEKDADTGIVRHLDDQCIGCSYCILKCPYEVPKFNSRLGIVRKCDMCSARLAEGEAPACVQACPNGAIGIRIVPRDAPPAQERLLPGVVSSAYTRPSTRYVTAKPLPSDAVAGDAGSLRVEHTHWPLVLMLVLTQASFGLFTAAAMSGATVMTWLGNAALQGGLLASVLHLGQPLRAWRAFLGWRKSWLSREILIFGGFAGASALTLLGLSAWWAVAAGAAGVFCSIMVYADTRRPDWTFGITSTRFGGTAVVMAVTALAAVESRWLAAALTAQVFKPAVEILWVFFSPDHHYRRRMHLEALPRWSVARVLGAFVAMACTLISPAAALVPLLAAEILERALFFKTVKAWRMPGV